MLEKKIEIITFGSHTKIVINEEEINLKNIDINNITIKKKDDGKSIILIEAKQ